MKSFSRKILWVAILITNIVGVAVAHSVGGKTAKKVFPWKFKNDCDWAGQLKGLPEVRDTQSKTFPVSQGGSLAVKSNIGSVEVEAVDSNTVNIELVRRIKAASQAETDEIIRSMQINFVHTNNDVEVHVKLPEEWDWDKIKRVKVDFKITIPRVYNLNVQTVGIIKTNDLTGKVGLSSAGFSLTTGNINGSARLSSAGGPISIGNVGGPLTLSSSGGSLRMGNVNGNLDVVSSGGSVVAGRVNGRATVQSSGGYIHIEEVTEGMEAVSLGGEVRTSFSRQPQADSSFVTGGGSVTLRLADSVGVTVDADTGEGSVDSDYPLSKSRDGFNSVFKGDLNGGGPKVTIRTAAGHLSLRRWDSPITGKRKH